MGNLKEFHRGTLKGVTVGRGAEKGAEALGDQQMQEAVTTSKTRTARGTEPNRDCQLRSGGSGRGTQTKLSPLEGRKPGNKHLTLLLPSQRLELPKQDLTPRKRELLPRDRAQSGGGRRDT